MFNVLVVLKTSFFETHIEHAGSLRFAFVTSNKRDHTLRLRLVGEKDRSTLGYGGVA
jgi:hypothetical protein